MKTGKFPFKHFLRRVGYYLSYPYPIWDRKVDTSWYNDTDTQSEFIIYTAEQLAGLGQLVNSGKSSFESKTIKLGKDIVLNDIADMENWEEAHPKNIWTPIGTNDSPFKGIFDGCGHIISGVYTENPHSDNQGLFGCIEAEKPGWQIKNLWVIAFIKGRTSIGGLTGRKDYNLMGQNFGYITKSYSTIILVGHADIDMGGLIGTHRGKSKIYNSRAIGMLKAPANPKAKLVGNYSDDDRSSPCSDNNCFNGIVTYERDAATKIDETEKELFRHLRNRLGKLPGRSYKTWSRYWGKIEAYSENGCIVINNLLRNADVSIYNEHHQVIYSINSENSCTLKIKVPAGTYIVEVNKEKYPYQITTTANQGKAK
jgi:hypothetical protein